MNRSFIILFVIIVIVLAAYDVFGLVTRACAWVEDMVSLTSAQSWVAVLQAPEEVATVVLFGEAQLVVVFLFGRVAHSWALET